MTAFPAVASLVDRLRGIYRIPITDGLGATGGGEEPDNPTEFVRRFETPPIQNEAATVLEALCAMMVEQEEALTLLRAELADRDAEIERLNQEQGSR